MAGKGQWAGRGDRHHMQNDFVGRQPKRAIIVVANPATNQQQYSGRKVAQAVIEMLGVGL